MCRKWQKDARHSPTPYQPSSHSQTCRPFRRRGEGGARGRFRARGERHGAAQPSPSCSRGGSPPLRRRQQRPTARPTPAGSSRQFRRGARGRFRGPRAGRHQVALRREAELRSVWCRRRNAVPVLRRVSGDGLGRTRRKDFLAVATGHCAFEEPNESIPRGLLEQFEQEVDGSDRAQAQESVRTPGDDVLMPVAPSLSLVSRTRTRTAPSASF